MKEEISIDVVRGWQFQSVQTCEETSSTAVALCPPLAHLTSFIVLDVASLHPCRPLHKMTLFSYRPTSRTVALVVFSLCLCSALICVVLQQMPPARDALLQWLPMHSFSAYAAVPAYSVDGGSAIHAFTQKLVPVQDAGDLDTPDLGYGYRRLENQALIYRNRLAQLNRALHNRVYYAYRKHLLQRGFLQPAATSVAYLQSELDALNAHVVLLAQELDEKNQLSAHMALLQSKALARMMAKVKHLAALIHASARRRIREHLIEKARQTASKVDEELVRSHDDTACCQSASDQEWIKQLSRAISLIQAQSLHQAKMLRHVNALSHEVEKLRARLHRARQYRPRYSHRYMMHHLRGKRPVHGVQLSQISSEPLTPGDDATAAATSATRKQKLNALLDKAEALNQKAPGSPSLGGLYDEIHSLRSLLAKLPKGPQTL